MICITPKPCNQPPSINSPLQSAETTTVHYILSMRITLRDLVKPSLNDATGGAPAGIVAGDILMGIAGQGREPDRNSYIWIGTEALSQVVEVCGVLCRHPLLHIAILSLVAPSREAPFSTCLNSLYQRLFERTRFIFSTFSSAALSRQ